MEIQDLKEFVNEKFSDLDKHLTMCFKNIDDKNIITDAAIEKLDKKVNAHDHWLWFLRGAVAIFVIVTTWIGFKIRF